MSLKDSSETDSTFGLIGGPVQKPSLVSANRWETETRAAWLQRNTTIDQLTEYGKSIHTRGKSQITPAFESAQPFDAKKAGQVRGENPYALNDGEGSAKIDASRAEENDDNLIGYRSHRGGTARSFLAGLGKQVAAELPPASQHTVAPGPFATEGNLPTDPYATEDRGRRKDCWKMMQVVLSALYTSQYLYNTSAGRC